ncbi:MAG: hypothetical protein WD068_02820 [Candidatus Babeliales bacterium]
MNKKLMITIAFSMMMQSASAFDFGSAWKTVSAYAGRAVKSAQSWAQGPQPASLWNQADQHGKSAWNWASGAFDKNVVQPYQIADAVTAPFRAAFAWMGSNPVGSGVAAFSTGAYPQVGIPALGAFATWYAVDQYSKKRSWNLTDNRKLGSALAGGAATLAFMHKPKLTVLTLALAGLVAYKKGWGPFGDDKAPEASSSSALRNEL